MSFARVLVMVCALVRIIEAVVELESDDTVIDYNMDDRIIASKYQISYPLTGFRCFPDGHLSPCDCDAMHIHPCCKDYESGECYLPTYYEWSDWVHCELDNPHCDDTQECRIKFDEISPRSWELAERKKRDVEMDDHYTRKNNCQVQRVQCRDRLHGEWGTWSATGECSSECLRGVLVRERECIDQATNETLPDSLCPGDEHDNEDSIPCNEDLCAATSTWEEEGRCYINDDGDCVIDATRYCVAPSDATLSEECSSGTLECPFDCSLIEESLYLYGEWSDCNSTCSPGMQSRVGECVYAIDNVTSTDCDPLMEVQFQECDTDLCGSYTAWTEGSCSVDCNGGTLTATRTCTDGGDVPAGCSEEERECNTAPCTINVVVTVITGDKVNAGTTAVVTLTIHGSLRSITVALDESSTSGTPFEQGNTDVFTFPAVPDVGDIVNITIGHDNTGADPSWFMEDVKINITSAEAVYDYPCGTWFADDIGDRYTEHTLFVNEQCHQENFDYDWTDWSNCSSSCTPGTRTRTGICFDLSTVELSDNCINGSETTQVEDCNIDYCPSFTDWSVWGACSETCGPGQQEQTRTCDTSPSSSPDNCTVQYQECDEQPCVVAGAWGEYSACNNTCSPGQKMRSRECFEEGTDTPASGCTEPLEEYEDCNTDLCDAYSGYTSADPIVCSAQRNNDSCGNWEEIQTRTCDGAGTVPDGCNSTYVVCDAANQPTEIDADLYIFVENSKALGGEEDNCASVTVLDAVRDFLSGFICTYNNLQDASKSRIAINIYSTGGGLDKGYDDTDLFTAIDDAERTCEKVEFRVVSISNYATYRTPNARDSVKTAMIYILAESEPDVIVADAGVLKTMEEHVNGFLGPDGVFAVVAAFPDDDPTKFEAATKFACRTNDYVSDCSNYLGTIYDQPGQVVERLIDLLTTS